MRNVGQKGKIQQVSISTSISSGWQHVQEQSKAEHVTAADESAAHDLNP
jgi:hypothetical protein